MQHPSARPPATGRPLREAAELLDRLANQLAVTAGCVELLEDHGAIPPDLRELAEAARIETRKAVESVRELAVRLDEAANAETSA